MFLVYWDLSFARHCAPSLALRAQLRGSLILLANMLQAILHKVIRIISVKITFANSIISSRSLKLNKSLHGHSILLVHIFKSLRSKALNSIIVHLYTESSDITAILILRFHDIKPLLRAGLIILNKLLEC